jgi:hypothetical protein
MSVAEDQISRTITIRLYHSDGSATRRPHQLIRTLYIQPDSAKPLTAKRAAKVLARHLPQFDTTSRTLIIRTDEGWKATRSFRPTAGCSFHYIWEDAVITEHGPSSAAKM